MCPPSTSFGGVGAPRELLDLSASCHTFTIIFLPSKSTTSSSCPSRVRRAATATLTNPDTPRNATTPTQPDWGVATSTGTSTCSTQCIYCSRTRCVVGSLWLSLIERCAVSASRSIRRTLDAHCLHAYFLHLTCPILFPSALRLGSRNALTCFLQLLTA